MSLLMAMASGGRPDHEIRAVEDAISVCRWEAQGLRAQASKARSRGDSSSTQHAEELARELDRAAEILKGRLRT